MAITGANMPNAVMINIDILTKMVKALDLGYSLLESAHSRHAAELLSSYKCGRHILDEAKQGYPFAEKIDTLIATMNAGHKSSRSDWRDACFAEADRLIEELVAYTNAKPTKAETLTAQIP